ncbi:MULTISPECIES: Stk1 family PASTA domain-containing Ser/Thr kinase [Streptomyces]|uniref:Stk1 family PASTA domain-containing Ser/Thr kinase n=1 Tax=Streptomyces TaxID=1883 RepID=UPI0015C47E8B|nr:MULTISPECIES: Stk1 family PASTA domain-containing Ser/Thr kinase [Streptomyces]MDW4900817.1 Stk1 family PASTA domain-containing Ser/Thr kinase [Streptomyces californicus]QLG33188.1 Stk1 family PASTA domain-containing Ser/Thr kinase [Streptomyces sp. CB04723]
MEEPRRLGGRYELGSVLGRGGMAEVYLAHDTRLGRTVAVKTLRADLARDPSFQARFRREAQSAASLNHPAIVAVYDTGEDYVDGVSIPYIVMEYVDGSTLRELLHSGRRLLPERTLEMTVGILQALEYSHRAQIVHRDIKPANVMLTRTGQVKVMDFGIARAMGDSGMTMTQTAAVIGTAQYLSPEQAKGEQVDARSDLYSTGCLLYELLAVRPPFVGDSPVAVAYQHVREEPQPPSTFDPEITPEMDAIVLKALTKDPDYRYQSADEMRADIEACLDGRPVAATAAMGAAGYGGYDGYNSDQPTTALRPADPNNAQTSMLPPINPDDGGYDDRAGRRRQQKKSNTSTILLIVAAVLVLIGAILIGRVVLADNSSDNQIKAPNLVGSTIEEAETLASRAGVTVKKGAEEPCEQQEKGQICTQDPAADATMDKDGTVTVVVSSGAPTVEVPNVMEKSEDGAREELEKKGFTVNVTTKESDKPEGTVIKQDPKGGEQADEESEVTITLAVQATLDLPDMRTRTFEAAQQQLNGIGFTNVSRTDVESDRPAGEVIEQTPTGPSKQGKDVQIVLKVSKGPAQPEKVQIPGDLGGMSYQDAKGRLEGLGFVVQLAPGSVDRPDARVVTSSPPPSTEADKGSTVMLVTVDGGGGDGGGDQGGGGILGSWGR